MKNKIVDVSRVEFILQTIQKLIKYLAQSNQYQ